MLERERVLLTLLLHCLFMLFAIRFNIERWSPREEGVYVLSSFADENGEFRVFYLLLTREKGGRAEGDKLLKPNRQDCVYGYMQY